ncbi:MAG: hypothetical protein IT378_25225 [Sandaracinaceae bacterium]|nr:hypothetical protein [Sandaracinaceae bacterium]
MERPSRAARLPAQGAILVLGLALWAVWPRTSFASLLGAYAIAWALIEVLGRRLAIAVPRSGLYAAAIVMLLAPVARLWDEGERFVEHEGLTDVDHYLGSALRLERTPSIAPPLVTSDRPQSFYVHAPGAERVRVRFSPHVVCDGRPLGHGVFRVELDPNRHEPLPAGELDVSLEVDGASHTRAMRSVRPFAHPRWLTASPDRRRVAAVSEETDQAFVLDSQGNLTTFATGDGPADVRFTPGGALLVVSLRYEGRVAAYDLAGRERASAEVGPFPGRLAIGGLDGRIAVARAGEHPGLTILSPALSVIGRVALDYTPDWIAFGPGGDTLAASSVDPPALHRIDRGPSGWAHARGRLWLGRPVVTMAASPGGGRVLVATTDFDPVGTPHLGNHFVQDQLLSIDVARWALVDQVLTHRRTSRQSAPGDVDRGGSPMAIDPLEGGALLVAFAGPEEVWRIDPGDPPPRIFPLEDEPLASPHGVAGLAGGGFAVSSPVHGTIAIFDGEGRRRSLAPLAPSDAALLAGDEDALMRRIGERDFYESTRSGVSCQSCHLHGGSDSTLHNIGGNVFAATLSTRGLMGTPPYLRDGGYGRLGSLHEVATSLYRGYLRAQGGRRVSLDRYLESLPRDTPPRQLEGRDDARERRGMDAFFRARCPLCHAPPAFTNLSQHPVQAIFPSRAHEEPEAVLDTPSLLGLGQSAPYLADGRARRLRDVFRAHDPDRRHGDTRSLEDEELNDLIYLLEGL